MPSAYTAPLHDGEPITFEQFALRCSRAMGAAIMQRDESAEVEIRLREVSDYAIQSVEKSGADLAEAWGRTVALPVAEYRERELGRLARRLERDTRSLEEERERVRGQNEWVTTLRESLGVHA